MADRADSWSIRQAHDGAFEVCGVDTPLAGASRIDLADGSYVEFDLLRPSRLVSLCAMPTEVGQQLLRWTFGDRVVLAMLSGEAPRRFRVAALAERGAELRALSRAAYAGSLASVDTPRRRSLWVIDALAALAELAWPVAAEHWVDLPVDDAFDLLEDALVERSFRLEQLDAISAVVRVVERGWPLSESQKDRLRRLHVGLRADPRLEFSLSAEDVVDTLVELASQPRPGSRTNPTGMPSVSLAIDRTTLPRQFDLALDARVEVSIDRRVLQIVIDGVRNRPSPDVRFRIFDPIDSSDPTHTKVRALLPMLYEAERVTARFEFLPLDFRPGAGHLAVDVVDASTLLIDPPSEFEYWAAATQSDVRQLMLMLCERERFGSEVQALTSRVPGHFRGIGELDYADEIGRLVVTKPPFIGFVTPLLMAGGRRSR